jgi:hypothetical protein
MADDVYIPATTHPAITSLPPPRRTYRGRSISNSRINVQARLERAMLHSRGEITVVDFTAAQLATLWRVPTGALHKVLRNGNGSNGGNHHQQSVEAALRKLQSLNRAEQIELVRQFGAEQLLELAVAAEQPKAAGVV